MPQFKPTHLRRISTGDEGVTERLHGHHGDILDGHKGLVHEAVETAVVMAVMAVAGVPMVEQKVDKAAIQIVASGAGKFLVFQVFLLLVFVQRLEAVVPFLQPLALVVTTTVVTIARHLLIDVTWCLITASTEA